MKEMVLLIGHGSRDADGNREFVEFADAVKKELPGRELIACFLEFADPDIEAGIEACVARGAMRIVVVPVILLAASHVKSEIPDILELGRQAHPDVEIVYGRNVGQHEAILELLLERFQDAAVPRDRSDIAHDAGNAHDPGNSHDAGNAETAIVLLGRGSSDPDANGDLYKIARMVWERTGVLTVETCFSGITTPRLPEGVKRAIVLGAKRVVVIPYFLFTGVLIKRMQTLLDNLAREYPQVSLTMTRYFGIHSRLINTVLDRIAEATEGKAFMNCDYCEYRRSSGTPTIHTDVTCI